MRLPLIHRYDRPLAIVRRLRPETGKVSMVEPRTARVAVVDDDASMREFMRLSLRRSGYTVEAVEGLKELRTLFSGAPPAALVMDLNLGDEDGIDVIDFLAQARFAGPIVIVSGVERRTLAKVEGIAADRGLTVAGALTKPFRPRELADLLDGRLTVAEDPVSALASAIDAGEIQAYFQPIVDLTDGRTVGAEALARWVKPDGTLVPPSAFIDLAESNGLMRQLTAAVLDNALAVCRRWRERGHPDIWVAVNSSPSLVESENFFDDIQGAIRRADVPAANLQLEVTESVAMNDVDRITEVLSRLSIKGIRAALDDFGTGFSSLTALYRIPFAKVKVDQSFVYKVARTPADDEAETIVKAILGLAGGMGLDVVAEGVETEAAARFLAELGCAYGQGYWFAKPMPGSAFLDFVETGPR